MTRLSVDQVWIDVAHAIAQRSRCSRAQVGSVIVGHDGRIVSTGYNGPASGCAVADDGPCSGWCPRAMNRGDGDAAGHDYSSQGGFCYAVHSEANCLLHAQRAECVGATMYSTRVPCMDCAKLISNSGVTRVVAVFGTAADAVRDTDAVVRYLNACGVDIEESKQ